DMPFDEEGKTIDIIFNPLGIPTRMNIGQLLETVLASAAEKLNTKLLCRPFNSPSPQAIKEIIQEAGIKNYGAQKLFDGQTGLPFQQDIYNGYIYTIKLNHMAADKFHAGHVAHGAAFNVNEMTGAKSDDIYKRNSLQSALLFNDRQVDLRSNQ
ncbi:11333_t:CDS:2, partial [Entrophospora sp. SA101]